MADVEASMNNSVLVMDGLAFPEENKRIEAIQVMVPGAGWP
jgi:hypothetical protein